MDRFAHTQYLIVSKLFSLIHGDFRIYDGAGNLQFFCRKQGFKLKEDVRLYTDESRTSEVLSIQARRVLDISATYDVLESPSRVKVGALRRKGLRSMFRDEWHLLDVEDRQIGTIQEESEKLALVRRFLTNLIPQSFDVIVQGTPVAEFKQNFNPFRFKLQVDFSLDSRRLLDRRLGLAAAVLLAAVEGRQRD